VLAFGGRTGLSNAGGLIDEFSRGSSAVRRETLAAVVVAQPVGLSA
jgi:hypothetical protein